MEAGEDSVNKQNTAILGIYIYIYIYIDSACGIGDAEMDVSI